MTNNTALRAFNRACRLEDEAYEALRTTLASPHSKEHEDLVQIAETFTLAIPHYHRGRTPPMTVTPPFSEHELDLLFAGFQAGIRSTTHTYNAEDCSDADSPYQCADNFVACFEPIHPHPHKRATDYCVRRHSRPTFPPT